MTAIIIALLVLLWLSPGLSTLAEWYVDEQVPTPMPLFETVFFVLTAPVLLTVCVIERWREGGYAGKHPASPRSPRLRP